MKVLHTPLLAAQWLHEQVQVPGCLNVDSRLVQPGDGFIAWPGAAVDGRQFVEQVLQQNAAAVLVEEQGVQQWGWHRDARVAVYPGLKAAMASIAAHYYGFPSEHLDVLAVTGTNGKTSTSWWLAQALNTLGYTCGMIGTLGVGLLEGLEPSLLTTPDPVRIHGALRSLISQGAKACAVEASSIGLAEHRFDSVRVKAALFTNVTQDHLDYHQSMQAYWQAKRSLFDWPGLQFAVVNVDDAYGAQLAYELQAQGKAETLYIYSRLNNPARLQAGHIVHGQNGVSFTLAEGAAQAHVQTVITGDYNVSNLLGIAGALRALGYTLQEIAVAFAALTPVPGRLQQVFSLHDDAPQVLVDYAHTPDALANVLQALQPVAKARGGRLWCVFGCGGNRDATKRPLMGHAAQQYADEMVVTSDNPRNENAQSIIEQILPGIKEEKSVHVEADRREAISYALAHADDKDVVLIAGKGHEAYQEIQGVRYPFSDADMASQLLNTRTDATQGVNGIAMMTLQQAKDLLQTQDVAARIHGDANTPLIRVHTDTRTLQPGDLFVALRGERFDAHDFLAQAKTQGAVAALAERGLAEAGMAGLEVADTLKALGALASGWRTCWAVPVIAVTGSNGKTTTTQMIASILHAWKGDAALATKGNLNNAIGVPLTLLRLNAAHEVVVIELGMNHLGEIAALAAMARPVVALVNNAQREHQEFMSTVQAVAYENGEVINALPSDGVAVFPADDEFPLLWQELKQGRASVMFALNVDESQAVQYSAQAQWDGDAWQVVLHTLDGETVCRLHIAGLHNVKNALAAAACTQLVGVPLDVIAQGLSAFRPVAGRSEVELLQWGKRQVTLVNDTYNANPDSVRAAIDMLTQLPQPALLVLGEMGEVGEQGAEFHQEVGEYACQQGIKGLWAAGVQASYAAQAFNTCLGEGGQARFFKDVNELCALLPQEAKHYRSILVKGSRFMRMERAVEQLRTAGAGQQGGGHVA